MAVLVRNLLSKLGIQGSQGLPHVQKSLTKFWNQKSGIRKLCSHKIRKLFWTIRLAPTEFWAPTQSGIRNNITVTITVSSVNISASSYQSPPSPWCAAWTAWSGLQYLQKFRGVLVGDRKNSEWSGNRGGGGDWGKNSKVGEGCQIYRSFCRWWRLSDIQVLL